MTAPVRELGSGPRREAGLRADIRNHWRSLFEREGGGRRNGVAARSTAKARSWRRQFEIGRDKLAAARAVREVRRAAREALSQSGRGPAERLLAAAGVDARKRSTIVSLRLEVETRRIRIGELEAELAKLRASRAVHAKAGSGARASAGSGRGRAVRARPALPAMAARPGRVSKSARSSQPRGGRARLLRLRDRMSRRN